MLKNNMLLIAAFIMSFLDCRAADDQGSGHDKIGSVMREYQQLLNTVKSDSKLQRREALLDEICTYDRTKGLEFLHALSPQILNEGSPNEVQRLLDNLDPRTIIYQPTYKAGILHYLALRAVNRVEHTDGKIIAILRSRLERSEVRQALTVPDQYGLIPFFAAKKAIGLQKFCSKQEVCYYTELLKLLVPDVKGPYLEARTIACELTSDDPSIFNQARNDYYLLPSELRSSVRQQFVFVRPDVHNFDT